MADKVSSLKRILMLGSWWTRYYRRRRTHRPSVSILPVSSQWQSNLTILDIGLQVLDNVIVTKWKVLPREQCQGKNVRMCVKDKSNKL